MCAANLQQPCKSLQDCRSIYFILLHMKHIITAIVFDRVTADTDTCIHDNNSNTALQQLA